MTTTNTTAPPGVLPLTAGRWSLDSAHSSVSFAIRHLGISKVRGVFHDVDVDVTVGESLDTTSVSATIAVASIDTGNADRDAHVRSAELVDAERRPTMVFRSTKVAEAPDGTWSLVGDLTIGDRTQPVTLAAELGGVQTHPLDGHLHAGFEATGEIRRSDFGITFGMLDAALGDVVKIAIDVQLIAPDAG
jgi:polyisoprenoid-binding protein YceI